MVTYSGYYFIGGKNRQYYLQATEASLNPKLPLQTAPYLLRVKSILLYLW